MNRSEKLEAIEKVYFSLKEQGTASVRLTERRNYDCAYRGERGAKCAVGHLIDDETAERWDNGLDLLDGLGGSSFIACVNRDKLKGIETNFPYKINDSTLNFMSDLQNCHDCLDGIYDDPDLFVVELTRALRNLCKSHKIKIPNFLR